ncbi:beta strand repeat-containing protein, partial [Tropicibacter sp. S64]|uniref:beta strand repeat-containing protein n=1 Tax=Tropicibacter sp. S64 TaxID=3415122 RepID=UPI003C7DA965
MTSTLRRSLVLCLACVFPSFAQSQVSPDFDFTPQFSPSSLVSNAQGSLTLTFTDSTSSGPITDIATNATLPTNVEVGAGGTVSSCFGATITAVEGAGTIAVTDVSIGRSQSCQISIPVLAGTISSSSTETVSFPYSSASGTHPAESANLTLSVPPFTVTKSLSLASMDPGSVSRVTYTLTAPASGFQPVSITESLPTGVVIASSPNIQTDCRFNAAPQITTVSATPGGSSAVMQSGYLEAGEPDCTFSFDVTSNAPGVYALTGSGSAGTFVKTLTVNNLPVGSVGLQKSFAVTQAGPGETVNLSFTLRNTTRGSDATAVTFSDNLSTMLAGSSFGSGLPASPCGAGSALARSTTSSSNDTLTLTGGALGAEASCQFTVPVVLPSSIGSAQTVLNQTSAVTGLLDGSGFTGNQASTTLFVLADDGLPPVLSKVYDGDTGTSGNQPVAPGDNVQVTYTIQNPNTGAALSGIAFIDGLIEPSGMIPNTGSLSNSCGGTFAYSVADSLASLTGGSLAAGATCTISLPFSVPSGTAAGDYTYTTGTISATVGSSTVSGSGATATVTVIGGANVDVSKGFAVDTVAAGSTATVVLALQNRAESPSDATGVTVSDDLDAFISGATISGAPLGSCGATLGGTASNPTFTVASLPIGARCEIQFDVNIPSGANGTFTNTTSTVTGTAGGQPVAGTAASASLTVLPAAPLETTVAFIPDTVLPGRSYIARYTLNNPSAFEYSSIGFNHGMISGSTVSSSLPTDFCGTGSSYTPAGSLFVVSNLTVAAGGSCTFDVVVTTSSSSGETAYTLTSSNVTATVSTQTVTLPKMSAQVILQRNWLDLTRSYGLAQLQAGQTQTVTYTITNRLDEAVSGLAFIESTGSYPAGSTLSGTPATTCGGSLGAGMPVSLTGGALGAGASCTVTASFDLPVSAPSGVYTASGNAPGASTATDSFSVTGTATTAQFSVQPFSLPTFSVAYEPNVGLGLDLGVTFTLTNTDAAATITDLQFTNDFASVLSGATIASGTLASTCGSAVLNGEGTGSLTASALSVPPSASCTVTLDLSVPSGATPGSYTMTSSILGANGETLASPASGSFTVEPNPGFSAAFAPASVVQGAVSTLTYTLDNSGATVAATNAAFSGTLESSLLVATPANASTTCTGGTLTASGSTYSYSGGTVAAGGSCTVQFDVVTSSIGNKSQVSGALASSLGDSGTATASLLVSSAPVPTFGKAFASSSIPAGGATTMTLTVNNAAALVAATSLDVTDNLPAGMTVASPANAATTCTGGTLTAIPGSGTVSYTGGTVAASSVCTVTVDVTLSSAGSYANTTGALTSSLGNSGTASATLSQPGIAITTPIAGDNIVNGAEAGSVNVSGNTFSVENGRTVTVTATDGSSGTASNTVAVSGGTFSLVLDMSGLADGPVSIAASVSDTNGSAATAIPASVTKDTTPPTGQTVAFDPAAVAIANQASVDFTLTGGEIGAVFSYQITDSGAGLVSGGPVTITAAPQQVTGLDLSALADGTLTVSVVLTDTNGNAAPAVTDTIEKDTAAPVLQFDSPLAGDDVVNAAEAGAVTLSGTVTGAEDGLQVLLDITAGGTTFSGIPAVVSGGVWSVVFDFSVLADGAVSLTADVTDLAGNAAAQVSASLTKDTVAPAGYAVAFDLDPVNGSNATAAGFSFSGAEIGAGYAFAISSDGGGTPVTGTGTIATATDSVTGLDLSGLSDGTLTVSVVLTDPAGNAGTAATDTAVKDVAAP